MIGATEWKNIHSAANAMRTVAERDSEGERGRGAAESIGDTSIGLVGRGVLNRFGRLGQSVETTLITTELHKLYHLYDEDLNFIIFE